MSSTPVMETKGKRVRETVEGCAQTVKEERGNDAHRKRPISIGDREGHQNCASRFFFELIEHTQGIVEVTAWEARGEVSGVFLLLVGLGKQWKGWAVLRARALLGNGEKGERR